MQTCSKTKSMRTTFDLASHFSCLVNSVYECAVFSLHHSNRHPPNLYPPLLLHILYHATADASLLLLLSHLVSSILFSRPYHIICSSNGASNLHLLPYFCVADFVFACKPLLRYKTMLCTTISLYSL